MTNGSESTSRKKDLPVILAIRGPLDGRRWEIQDELIIGRGTDCHIQIDDRQVSRHHARISNNNGKVAIEDLSSKNGTFLAGRMISEQVALADADTFQIAMVYKFVFYCSDATMPMEDLIPPIPEPDQRLVVDGKSRRVWIGGDEILPSLSAPQFRLLSALYTHAGRVVSREELVQAIWEEEAAAGVSEEALDALIRRLRERLSEIDPAHQYVVTVRGHGLRFSNNK